MTHKPPKPDLRCNACRDDKCGDCMNILLDSMGVEASCPCTRKHHAQRVKDAIEENLDNLDDAEEDWYLDMAPDVEMEAL